MVGQDGAAEQIAEQYDHDDAESSRIHPAGRRTGGVEVGTEVAGPDHERRNAHCGQWIV